MNKNKVLDFILKEIQWGYKKNGEKFWSEKQLAIKFGVSLSTVKTALITTEALGLIEGGKKGQRRITKDFTKYIYLTNYFITDSTNISIERIFPKDYDNNDRKFLHKYFNHQKISNHLIINLLYKNNKIGKFFSIVHDDNLYKNLKNENNDFVNSLKSSKILIKRIEKIIYFEQENPIIWKKIIDINNKLIEESFLLIDKKFFFLQENTNFPFS